MIPMLHASLLAKAARDLPAGRRDEVVLVARPRGVVHVAVAPTTPSGRFIPVAASTVCSAHTRRLGVIPRVRSVETLRGRRVCARCSKILSARTPGLDGRPMPRDVEVQVFGFLTLANLTTVARSCVTVDETHEVGRLALMLYGPAPLKPRARRTPLEQERCDLEDLILQTRRRLVAEGRTDEERAAVHQLRETQAHNDALSELQRRRSVAIDTALEKKRAGRYLLPHEKQLLQSA